MKLSPLTPQSVFVTGTDTGVGKTVASALIARFLRSHGHDAGVMKPLASGCEWVDGSLVSEDAVFLKTISGVSDSLDLINPVRWEEPLAPLVAARRAPDAADHWQACLDAYAELRSRHPIMVVEGVGGVTVPLLDRQGKVLTCLDLVQELGLPVVIVARRMLGTINHTVLTVQALRGIGAEIAGLVFCDSMPVDDSDIAVQTSPEIIAEMTGLPVLAIVPYQAELSPQSLEYVATRLGD